MKSAYCWSFCTIYYNARSVQYQSQFNYDFLPVFVSLMDILCNNDVPFTQIRHFHIQHKSLFASA